VVGAESSAELHTKRVCKYGQIFLGREIIKNFNLQK
jgi:hypothetical protein